MASDYIVVDLVDESLSACGVTTAFSIASVHNIPMLDTIGRRNTIRFVMERGEISDMPFFKLDRADAFGDTVARTLAAKGLTLVEVDMNAVGEFRAYCPFNRQSA
jgi:hypothetical protein